MKPNNEPHHIDKRALRDQLFRVRREGFEGVDLARLPELLRVAAQLVDGEPDPRRQLESVVELAIGDMPEHQQAARIWFGLTEQSRGKDKDEREGLAAKERFVTPKAFHAHDQKRFMDWIDEALISRFDPLHEDGIPPTPSEPEPITKPTPTPTEDRHTPIEDKSRRIQVTIAKTRSQASRVGGRARPTRRRRSSASWLLIVAASVGITLVGLFIAVTSFGGSDGHALPDPTREVPPVGTVVNAETGEAVRRPDKGPIHHSAFIPEGNIMRACNITERSIAGANCEFAVMHGAIVAEGNDLLLIGVELDESGEVPMPYVHFEAKNYLVFNERVVAELLIHWNSRDNDVDEKIDIDLDGEYDHANLGSIDVSVGHVTVTLPGRGGHNPPSFSIAREINA